MATLQALFERLEYWRNFPGFQLERHVDVFISFYLKQVIEKKFNTPISDYLIPEFPINQHLIVTRKNGGQWSNKVDFALPSKDLSDIYFIELKTDMKSKRTSQDKLMEKCNGMMFYEFLVGIKKICLATKHYAKYATLLSYLQDIGYITIPKAFWRLDFEDSPYGYKKCVENIVIHKRQITIKTVFIQPRESAIQSPLPEISFEYFANVIAKPEDLMSMYFAEKLKIWSSDPKLVRHRGT